MERYSPNRGKVLVSRYGRGGGGGVVGVLVCVGFFCEGLYSVRSAVCVGNFFAGGVGLTRQKRAKKITPAFAGAIFLLLMR